MIRVDVDDPALDMLPDMSVTYEGRLFTGETVETHPHTGQVIAVTSYADGLQHGPSREWYADGTPRSEGQCERGLPAGLWREWHPNGRVASEQEFTGKGRMISRRTWSPEGEVLEDRSYDV